MKYIVVARVVDKGRLVGVKVFADDGIFHFVEKSRFASFFKNEVINCEYRNGSVRSTIKGLEIRKFPRYNKRLSREHILSNYTEAYILSQVTNRSEDDVTYSPMI